MMKKILYAACIAVLFSCSGNMKKTADGKNVNMKDSLRIESGLGEVEERQYRGILPAADCEGIKYQLTLWNQQHSGDGVFDLDMTYLGVKDRQDTTFYSYGHWVTLKGRPGDESVIYQLHPDASEGDVNFLFRGDSLIMLGSNMQPAESTLNYTLRRAR